MQTIQAGRATLLVVDVQTRLMPAIHDGSTVIENARRLVAAAKLLDVPVLATEQNPRGLGPTVEALPLSDGCVISKMTFDAAREPSLLPRINPAHDVLVLGCEAHVCVLQTVLGLRAAGRNVFVVTDAIGSRNPDNRLAAIRRMERHGAEAVTTEMVVFEWLGSAGHPRFREAVALIK